MSRSEVKKSRSLASLTPQELAAKIGSDRKELAKMRQAIVMGELKNYRQIRNKKKEIARALTELTNKRGGK